WYLVFSQLVPGDKTRMVPASALVNDIKFTLIPKDFKYYVLALDDYRQKHLKVKKRPLVHWCLLKPVGDEVCPVCGAPKLKRQKLCARCSGLLHRMQRARFTRQAIEGVWTYLHHYGFVDYYTGMDLDTDDPKSPWYLVFDHWSPRDPRKIVVTLALVNRMKGDLTEKEFWYFIHQLAQHFRRGTPVRKRKLKFWSRPYR
ncbi:MAG: hypothetical protein KGJ11_07405, partial [Candidatus Omnitrophica bacterium]|nr:hypothetical protein [Candidatus Omnitrophota bacterium]